MTVSTQTRSPRVEHPSHEIELVRELVAPWSSRALSVLRIVAGLAFMLHGTQKLFGFPPTDQARPELVSLLGIAGIMEAIGGLHLTVGLFTRPVAAVLCVEMAIAYLMVHAPQGVFPMLNGGEPALLFGVIFFYLAFAGGGSWSMDSAVPRHDDSPERLTLSP